MDVPEEIQQQIIEGLGRGADVVRRQDACYEYAGRRASDGAIEIEVRDLGTCELRGKVRPRPEPPAERRRSTEAEWRAHLDNVLYGGRWT